MKFGEEFKGRRVLITGAAGVIGRWIAEAFAAEGANLLLSDIRQNALASMANELLNEGVDVHCHYTDLREEDSILEMVNIMKTNWGSPDIVINNAGVYPRNNLLDMSVSAWKQIMDINVTAPFLVARESAKLMIEQGVQGSMITISSGAATSAAIGGGHYSTSKAAVAMLTRALSLELAPHGIRINAVGPGFAPGSEVSPLSDEYIETMISSIPLGRTSGPHDAPSAILFLCSSSASFITGASLSVDGGRSAGNFRMPKRSHGGEDHE